MDVKDRRTTRWRLRTVLFAAIASLVGPSLRAADGKITFNIPAGDFSQTVLEFYKQTQVEILYASSSSVDSIKTRAVVGSLDVTTALARMLEGTGFTFEFENAHSVLLKRVTAGSAAVEIAPEASTAPDFSGNDVPGLTTPLAGEEAAPAPLNDIVVTGTYIHGVLDIMSPLVRVDRSQMRRGSYATVYDALQTLPSNSGAGLSDDFSGNNGNYNKGTAPNLRGLGYGATLVLVNGHRQPLAGSQADFVDLSNIPWSAVERIEVLPDGSSALYGSDAIAGVVNIVMREDLDGAETQGRFTSSIGGRDEKVFAQLFGNQWDGGKWLASYQYAERSALPAADRLYAMDVDKRALGGSDHRSIWGNPGNILDPGTLEPLFAIPRDQNGGALTPADLIPGVVNLHNTFAAYDLTPERRMHSLFLNGSQKLSERLQLYGEARFGERRAEQRQFDVGQLLVVPNTNPFFVDAYGGMPYVLVAYDFRNDLGPPAFSGKTLNYDGTFGIKADLGRGWRANLFASYGREDLRWSELNVPNPAAIEAALADPDPATALNPFADGSFTNPQTLEAIRTTYRSRVISDIEVASLIADGGLFDLPTGSVKLAVGAEARRESLNQHLAEMPHARFARNIASTFAELSVPLVGKLGDSRSIPRLELSLAGRYEKYSDFGDTFNPKLGLRWVPLNWAKFRTSWGSSFKAPKLLNLYDTSQNLAGMIPLPDPRSENGQSLVLVRQGNNPDLKEETARTWTAGIDVIPTMAPGLTLSLTYYDINYEDRIVQPGPPSPFDILFQEALWTESITRNPSQAQIAEICNSPQYLGSPVDCLASTPAAIVDFRLRNLAITRTKGIDLKVDYDLDTRYGGFELGLAANRVFSFDQASSSTAPNIDIVDTVGNPLALRIRTHAEWQQRGHDLPGWRAGLTVDHTGAYRDVDIVTPRAVESFTTIDLRLGYRTGRNGGWLDGTEIALNAVNILDTAPPFVDRNFGYDVLNTDPTGRLISLYVEKSW